MTDRYGMRDDVIVVPAVKEVVATWRKEAAQRKTRWKDDPVAATLESSASELESEIEHALETTRTVSVQQYAHSARTTPSTVRRWILRGELEAEKGEDGEWQIPRTARRQRKERHLRVVNG
jgi:hypothetical protein